MPLAVREIAPVPPLDTPRAVAKARLLKVGLELVAMFWTVLMVPAVAEKLVLLN